MRIARAIYSSPEQTKHVPERDEASFPEEMKHSLGSDGAPNIYAWEETKHAQWRMRYSSPEEMKHVSGRDEA